MGDAESNPIFIQERMSRGTWCAGMGGTVLRPCHRPGPRLRPPQRMASLLAHIPQPATQEVLPEAGTLSALVGWGSEV